VGAVFEVLLLLSPELPPLSDAERFPPRCFATTALEFNRSYRGYVENQQAFDVRSYWDWNDVLNETDYCYNCWSALAAVQGAEGEDERSRRAALVRLRELIGDEAYYQGAMPPTVPVWRFWCTN
jgi:hypothetical protein